MATGFACSSRIGPGYNDATVVALWVSSGVVCDAATEANQVRDTIEHSTTEVAADSGLRGLFRRGRRQPASDSPNAHDYRGAADEIHARVDITDSGAGSSNTAAAVATVDDIARRMDLLTSTYGDAVAHEIMQDSFDVERARIARANLEAASPLGTTMPAVPHERTNPAPAPLPMPTNTAAPEAHVTTETSTYAQTAPATPEAPLDDAQIQARMDAVLTPAAPTAAPAQRRVADVQLQQPVPMSAAPVPPPPAAVNQAPAPTPVPVPSATVAPAAAAPAPAALALQPTRTGSAAQRLGIDVDRIAELIEEEARTAQQRIELEVRSAHAQASEIVGRAEVEAERIREHGQAQARVLLSEVEEIISEAQQTGEQILHRANGEATTIRGEATGVLHTAQTEARAIVETARREGEQVLAEQRRLATVRAQEAMREQDRLKDQIRRLEERRRQVLESLEPLIAQLTQMMPAQIDAASGNVVQLDRTRTQA
ncbi:MAG: hypothetical protein JWN41_149 [Thermoleophilia bacterium]|nr:hypothetical protein [Thermoleophilia bacterium]